MSSSSRIGNYVGNNNGQINTAPLSRRHDALAQVRYDPASSGKAIYIIGGAIALGVLFTVFALYIGGEQPPPPTPPPLVRALFEPLARPFLNCSDREGVVRHVRNAAEGEAYLHPFEYARVHPCCVKQVPIFSGSQFSTSSLSSLSSSSSSSSSSSHALAAAASSAPVHDDNTFQSVAHRPSSKSPASHRLASRASASTMAAAIAVSTSTTSTPSSSSSVAAAAEEGPVTVDDILFVVLTAPKRSSQTVGVMLSWAQGIESIVFVSDDVSPLQAAPRTSRDASSRSSPAADAPQRLHIALKYLRSRAAYAELLARHRWVVVVDDLTWVNVPALLTSLASYSSHCPVALAHVWSKVVIEAVDYPSGRAGIILSTPAFKLLTEGHNEGACSFYTSHDVTTGRCLWSQRVQLVHLKGLSPSAPSMSRDRLEHLWLPPVAESISYHGLSPAEMHLLSSFSNSRWDYVPRRDVRTRVTVGVVTGASSAPYATRDIVYSDVMSKNAKAFAGLHHLEYHRRSTPSTSTSLLLPSSPIITSSSPPAPAPASAMPPPVLPASTASASFSPTTTTTTIATATTSTSSTAATATAAADHTLAMAKASLIEVTTGPLDSKRQTEASGASSSSTATALPDPDDADGDDDDDYELGSARPPRRRPSTAAAGATRLIDAINKASTVTTSKANGATANTSAADDAAAMKRTSTTVVNKNGKKRAEERATSTTTSSKMSASSSLPPLASTSSSTGSPSGSPTVSQDIKHQTATTLDKPPASSTAAAAAAAISTTGTPKPSSSSSSSSITTTSSSASTVSTPSLDPSLSPYSAMTKLQANPLVPQVMIPKHLQPKGRLRSHAEKGYKALNLPFPSKTDSSKTPNKNGKSSKGRSGGK